MRPRERILANLESIYRESYERAKTAGEGGRMIDLESAYMRDHLMLEILLDIRDLFSGAPPPRVPARFRSSRPSADSPNSAECTGDRAGHGAGHRTRRQCRIPGQIVKCRDSGPPIPTPPVASWPPTPL